VVAVQSQPDQITAAHRGVAVHAALLRDVAQIAVTGARRMPIHPDGAGPQPVLAQERAQQRGLAGAVGAQDRDELTRLDVEGQVVPDDALTEAQLCIPDLEDRGPVVGITHARACSTESTMPVIQVT
jgi:hypothetical protein